MKRTVAVILICLLLCSITSAVAGTPGSSGDPLVSKSYVDDTFKKSVIAEGEKLISAKFDGPSSSSASSGYALVSIKANGCASLGMGASFMPLSGSVTVTVKKGAVIDIATGEEVKSGASLAKNHCYFCAEDTAAEFVSSSGCNCLIDGKYTIGISSNGQAPKPNTVVATTLKVKFNDELQKMEVYNIDGNTYYKLRDIAALMMGTSSEFSVDYDVSTKMMYTYTPGTYELVGGELQTGTDKSKSCISSPWKLSVNNEIVSCYIYNLANNNFFKLRDLGDALGFYVDYDSANRTVLIYSEDYMGF